MNVLGISAFYHDSAACLLQDGRIVAASQEERFTRRRHDHNWPERAVADCLRTANLRPADLDLVAFYDKPLMKFERLLETYVSYAPAGFPSFLKAMPLWLGEKLWIPDTIRKRLPGFEKEILFCEHHESHAASAFFPSPFERAAVLTIDGVGEWTTTSIGIGEGNRLRLVNEIRFPHSLGLLYSAFTYYTGFRVNSGEYKVMGLAPYGEPRFADLILEKLMDLRDDGSFRLTMEYFDFCAGLTMTNQRFHALFGGPPRAPESRLTQREMDLAASVQLVCEKVMVQMARRAYEVTGCDDLCLAGGVALNCVGNHKILRDGPFKRIWIQPAAGDAGGALGAAYVAWHHVLGKPRDVGSTDRARDEMHGALLGPEFSDEAIESFLHGRGASFQALSWKEMPEKVARLLADEKVVGWFQGRMEFGPRALGARSILGDPRSERMQAKMNLKIKFRESFRPFAPSILRERLSDWFDLDCDSPYMLLIAPVRKERRRDVTDAQNALFGIDKLNVPRSSIPAVTHVDYSARVQTVHRDTQPLYHDLLSAFERQTGCPVLTNTSFNVRGEPIVCTPEDAYRCFLRTKMDHLVLGRYLLDRSAQPEAVDDKGWQQQFALD
jgi:carbamoyltransferase